MSHELIPSHLLENNAEEKGVSFYPLPSNENYEKFLQKFKKEQCKLFLI